MVSIDLRASRIAVSERGYMGLFQLVVLAVAFGLVAAWNMAGRPVVSMDAVRALLPAAPHPGELANLVGRSKTPLATMRIAGHRERYVTVSATSVQGSGIGTRLLMDPGAFLDIKLPHGRYELHLVDAMLSPGAATGAQGLAERSYVVTLTAAGLVLDLNRPMPERLPFPQPDR